VVELARVNLDQIDGLSENVAGLEKAIAREAKRGAMTCRLQTMSGVGPIAAMAVETFAPPMAVFRKSVRQAFELDGIYCISRSDRTFALTVPRPPHTTDVPLAARPDRGSEGGSRRTSIIFALCQLGPD
jgi:hypothetical protein